MTDDPRVDVLAAAICTWPWERIAEGWRAHWREQATKLLERLDQAGTRPIDDGRGLRVLIDHAGATSPEDGNREDARFRFDLSMLLWPEEEAMNEVIDAAGLVHSPATVRQVIVAKVHEIVTAVQP